MTLMYGSPVFTGIRPGFLQAAGGAAIDLAALALTYGDHGNYQTAVDHFIDQAITDGAQLDLVAVGHIPEFVGLDPRILKALLELLGELQLYGFAQLTPLLECLGVELQGVLSRLRRLAR